MTDPLQQQPDHDPARTRKLITAAVAILAVVAITYAMMAKQATVLPPVATSKPVAENTVVESANAATPAKARADNASTKAATPLAATTEAKAETIKINADDIVFGEAKAPVTIVEYASLSCSHCAHFQADLFPKLDEKYIATGKVKLVHRFFPLNEPALRASQLAACEKDKAHAFIKVLFSTQDQWAFDPSYKESLARIAGVGGISREKFDQCLADKSLEEKILNQRKLGQDVMGVDSTPTFFINGTKYEDHRTIEEFSAVIDPLVK